MTTTIDITLRRRVVLHDDQIRYDDFYAERGIERIDIMLSIAPLMQEGDDEFIGGYVVGQVIVSDDGFPVCSLCGSVELQYSEGVGCINRIIPEATKNDEQGLLLVFGNSNYCEGDGDPGVQCGTCYATLDHDAEIDWS